MSSPEVESSALKEIIINFKCCSILTNVRVLGGLGRYICSQQLTAEATLLPYYYSGCGYSTHKGSVASYR